MLTRICGWCNRAMQGDDAVGPPIPKEQQPKGNVTHGMCKACFDKAMAGMDEIEPAKTSFANYVNGRDQNQA